MSNHIQITFNDLQPEQQDILVAHLAEADYDGFEQSETELKAFIMESYYDKVFLHELAFKYQFTFTEQIIPGRNWNAVWESNFSPVTVDDFVTIRADFHEPASNVQHEIIITPKMSFGTGHHATTHMMVQQMRSMNFMGKSVFDFGTGTGVLAILAEKLGAATVLAIDNDDWSIDNAKENCQKNNCEKIRLVKADSAVLPGSFDIILANINKNVILDNLSALNQSLQKEGTLVLSGLLSEDEKDIIAAIKPLGIGLRHKQERNNWICLSFSR